MDNASNNDTFMETLERVLGRRGITFSSVDRRIRYVFNQPLNTQFNFSLRCFPHIVNLACKAVLTAITKLDFAKETAQNYVPTGPAAQTFADALRRDPIATSRSLIRGVHFACFHHLRC